MIGAPKGDAQVVSTSMNSFVFSATGAGRFIYRQRNLAGWEATINGETVPIVDGTWLSVDLLEGENEIKFKYVAPGYKTGLAITVFALLLTAIWYPISRNKQIDADLLD